MNSVATEIPRQHVRADSRFVHRTRNRFPVPFTSRRPPMKPLLARRAALAAILVALMVLGPSRGHAQDAEARLEALIPVPASISSTGGDAFVLSHRTVIAVDERSQEAITMAHRIGDLLRDATGYPLNVLRLESAPDDGVIHVHLDGGDGLGDEGYELDVTAQRVTIGAAAPAGLFYGMQTLRQLLPPQIEAAPSRRALPEAWQIAPVNIIDQPRFGWRGAMLDVSRHFFGVDDVKHVIDLLSAYKMNRLHLHLSDDQGWRIEIKSWPNLALHGGQTQVDGGGGGYFTQDDYREIIAYAEERFITIVPEIDMPGHTNAALASYPELNCDGVARELYTGIRVGFSSLCVDRPETYKFVDDVLTELAMLTPGDYLHIGGDEVETLTQEEYNAFIERVEAIVREKGKRAVGWEEIAHAELHESSIAQHWQPVTDLELLDRVAQIIISPANRMYLDMKYDSTTVPGLAWAGTIEVDHAYDWEPLDVVEGISEDRILGVESPLWTERVETRADIEYMMFPRVAGFAEMGWSPRGARSWSDYRVRLARHGARWDVMGINFYRSPLVDW